MSKTRMGKRVASLLLSLVMMLSLLPTTVYAEGADTGDTTDEIVGQATTSGDNTEGTGEPEPTGEGEDGSANVTEGEDGAATNDAVVEETIAPVNAEGVDAVANAESSGDEQPDGADNMTSSAVAKIGDKEYATLDDAIKAVQNGEIIEVNAGEYKLKGSLSYAGKAFTIAAADGAKVSFDMSAAVALHGAKITFNGVTFNYKTNNDYIGLQHADTLVYNNCTINGMVFLYAGNETFNGCTFNQKSADAYNVWTYGAQNVAFNGCTFNCVGKAVLVYNEGAIAKTDLTVTDTKFIASAPVEGKAAIEIDTSLMEGGATITVDEQTKATGFAEGSNSKNSLWNDKVNETVADNKDITVIVNNETVYAPKATASAVAKVDNTEYATLQAAIDAANAGDIVTLLANTTEDVTINKNITLDLGGKTLTNTNAGKATISVTGGIVTVKNGTVIGGTSYYNIEVTKGSNANLTLEDVTATAGNTGSSMIDNWGTLTINSGTYTGGLDTVKNEPGAKLTINDGTFELKKGSSDGFTGVVFNYGNLTITGGTFIQSDKSAPYGQAQVIHTDKSGSSAPSTVITGGTFKNLCTRGTAWTVRATNAAAGATKVSGGTFNKSVSESYCADGFIPTKNADGTYDVKEGKYVAKSDTTKEKYDTLQAAIKATSKGKTVTLLTDVTENVEISKGKRVTLDLNGFTLNGGTGTAKAALTNYGTITIKDSSADKAGTIKRDDKGTVGETSYYVIDNKGTMTIESGNVRNNSGYRKTNPSGSMVGSSLICNGDDDALTPVLNIKGGKFVQENFIAIKNGALGVLHVTGGTITSEHSAIQNWFEATITGGTINGQLWTDAFAWKEGESVGKTTIGGDAKFTGEIVMDIYGNSVAPKLEITGGKLDVTNWRITTAAATAGAKPAISGGTFTSAVPESYCADGYIPTKNEGGTYGVKGPFVAKIGSEGYATLQAAIEAASRNGTVKMLADTRENVTISTPYLTLDLNGFTLNGSTGERKPALTITARVTVKDSSVDQTGTIMREDTAENSGVSSHYVIDVQGDGWLTFEGGNVKNGSGAGGTKGASLVRVGDDSVAKYPGLNIKGGTFTQDNFIVIKVDRGDLFLNGGTLTSAASYAIENWHRATVKGGTVNGDVSSWTYSGGLNSSLEISGGTINGDVTSVNYGNAEGKKATVTIKGGAITGELDTRSYDPTTGNLTSITDAAKATIEVTGGTFSSDPSKYLVEGSTATENENGTFGVAKAYLAKVGNTSYYTMEEAFKAQTASGEAIVLLRDYTTGSTFNSGTVARVVDLGGYTWTCTGTDANSAAFEINNPNASLTVKNGKIVSSQLVGLIPSAMGGTIKYDNSRLTFESVEMSTTATSGIETNGNNTNDTVTLKNSTLNVPNGFGIYFPSSGTLTIDNSTINAKTMGVQVCAGSLSITGADTAITVSGDGIEKTGNDGAIQDGAAISIVNRPGYKGLGKIEVTGGTFKANGTNEAIKAYDWKDNSESAFTANGTVAVSGGSFSSAVPEGLCANGYIPTTNSDGTHTVKKGQYVAQVGNVKYESLAAAIGAAQDGDTVTLLKDIDLPATAVVKGKTITLDLNGKTISNSKDIWNESIYAWSLISVRDKGNLTIEDTTGGGTLKAKENDCYALDVQDKDTALTVNAGTYVGNISAIYAYDGKVTINGGHFSIQQKKDDGDPYRFTLNCYDSNYKADSAGFTVNGGTFTNFDPRNNKAEGAGTSFVAEGVGVNSENGTFTAVPNMAAQIIAADGSSVKAYDSLAEAIEAAQAGQTVMLLGNIDLDKQIATGKAITIDGQGKYTIKATKKLAGTNSKAGMFYRTTSAQGTLTFLNVTLDGNGVSKIFLNEGGAGETVFDGVTSINGSGMAYGSGIHISGGGSHATIRNSTLTGSTGTTELNADNYYAANDLWVGGNVYVTVENSTIGTVFVNSAPTATATNGVVHGQLTITGENTKITYLSGEEEDVEKVDKFGNNGSLVKIDSGSVDTIFDKGSYEISGGTFKTEIKPEWCARGYVPTKNTDGTYTVKEANIAIQVTSRIKDDGVTTVSTTTGGGMYCEGEKVTVTTSNVVGFKFLGWYEKDSYMTPPLSADLSYTFTASKDCTLVALYSPAENATLTVKVTASAFKITGSRLEQNNGGMYKLPVGSSVTVTYTDDTYTFLYWVNGSDKIVSTSPEYTFTLGSNTELRACTSPKNTRNDNAMVVFKTAYDQVLTAKRYGNDEEIVFPMGPSKTGYKFIGWSMTQAEIRAAMAENDYIVVTPKYETLGSKYTVTVKYEGIGKADDTHTINVGDSILLTAAETVSEKTFSYWMIGDQIVSYLTTLTVFESKNVTVTAVYGVEANAEAKIRISDVSATQDGLYYLVTFTQAFALPEDATLVLTGFIRADDEESAANMNINRYSRIYKSSLTRNDGVYYQTIASKNADKTYYMMAFVQYKDAKGNLQTVYSECVKASYASLKGGN